MGRTHSVSAAAGWLAACVAVAALGHRPTLTTVTVGAVVAAGSAVAPDADHPQATVAQVFGPVSRWMAGRVARFCAWVHVATKTRLDPPRGSGHRTFSHTAVAGLAAGCGVAGLCAASWWAAVVVVFATTGLAARSMFNRRDRGNLGATLAGLLVAAVVGGGTSVHTGWWWLGVPVAAGWLAHLLGDAMTNSGCPIVWPLLIRGRRWYPVGTPRVLRFHAGDAWELRLVLPVFTVAGLASAGWLLATV
jgi:LexA-binding, inner membrane-associated putative hydrolase